MSNLDPERVSDFVRAARLLLSYPKYPNRDPMMIEAGPPLLAPEIRQLASAARPKDIIYMEFSPTGARRGPRRVAIGISTCPFGDWYSDCRFWLSRDGKLVGLLPQGGLENYLFVVDPGLGICRLPLILTEQERTEGSRRAGRKLIALAASGLVPAEPTVEPPEADFDGIPF